ncbi:type II toxin-antitoxin system Phd/YefM family antitoxin [Companilactobacillus jidongensis]|uniref:type II toxin-antitoxin system Phd/YefM family antitoxin n=1 Tax=Companilactobacillus jidongensis TaxID=2486006 RepID=UPI000F7A44B0|nr:type II toxin-antitoxin system Phd/YefM family antitoxin [Companilactobacillus jidongensis]
MEAVSYSNFRQNLKKYFKQVNQNSEPLIVTNKNVEDDVVVMSKDDYDSMTETMRIMSNPELMERLRDSEEQFRNGEFKEHELIEGNNEKDVVR